MAYAVYGTGGFAREVAPLLEDIWLNAEAMRSISTERVADIVFVDDDTGRPETCGRRPVIDFDGLTSRDHRHRNVVIAIGSGAAREKIEARCIGAGLKIIKVRATTAKVLANVEIGAGVVLCDYVVLTSDIQIGKSFQANLHSYVGHDCIIGDYVTFAPRVSCNGNVHVGDHAYIGTGAMIVQGTKEKPMTIGNGAIVAMGAVVTKPVDPYTLVAGNPARLVRTLEKPE